MKKGQLKTLLESLYRDYDFQGRLNKDPLVFAHRYDRPEDREVVAFIASAFAYGRVELFFRIIQAILNRLGPEPYRSLVEFDPLNQGRAFQGLYYRLSRDGDILRFLYGISESLREYRTLEILFYETPGQTLRARVRAFLDKIRGYALRCPELEGFRYSTIGLSHLLPLLRGNSAAKRFNLFLRWVVRTRDTDLGLWKVLLPSELIIPLDTHIARISRCLGLTTRTTPSWTMAEEVTDSLREFDPEDPLKYDFALCHEGIKGHCIRLCGGRKDCPIK